MSSDSYYVSKGLMRVAKSPIVLRAVVGPGFVVCVRTPKGALGGMVHLEVESLRGTAAPDRILVRVGLLLDEIGKRGSSLESATADIVGGADILRIYPQHIRQEVISAQVKNLTSFLVTKGVAIERTRVGGSEARRVEMILPGNRLEVRSVSRPRRKGLEAPARRTSPLAEILPTSIRAPEIVVNMGCLEVAESPGRLVALLGSCVGIALYDPEAKIGGLAHVMLPSSERGNGDRSKFADTAVPALIEALSKAGGSKKRLVAKLAGGANVLRAATNSLAHSIGQANIESSVNALEELGIDIVWQDLGGQRARKMSVSLDDFDVSVRLIESGVES